MKATKVVYAHPTEARPEMPEMPKDDGSSRTPWLDKWSFMSEGKRVTIAVETYGEAAYEGKREVLDIRSFIEQLHKMDSSVAFKISIAEEDCE